MSSTWRAELVGHRHGNGVVFKVGHSGFTELSARRFTVSRRHLSGSAADDEALVAAKTGPLKLDPGTLGAVYASVELVFKMVSL